MDERIANELRTALDRHADHPELRELWLRVLGLQLLAEDLSRQANERPDPPQVPSTRDSRCSP